ncbi:MAG: hypothetical protein O2820_12445 [Planctomycetota bacterium]|nr:hypothetical protein [Planctomycetota bacterium]MDA1250020.1 hypothetical protein [Planctomycetota bacterium]
MSDAFDPYHKWLAIPPQHQPPHHYRLLGIAEFEADADVIDAAANQRMSYLQDMAAGPHMAESQKLLNEIAAARRCLLNAAAKSAYDTDLKTRLQPAAAATLADQPPSQPAEPPSQPQSEPTSRLPSFAVISAASLGILSIIVAIVLVSGFFGGEEPEEKKADVASLKVKWKLDERDGAHVMIDSQVIANGSANLPTSEDVTFDLDPGDHRIVFERTGHRPIQFRYRFLPGESKNLELRWRKR